MKYQIVYANVYGNAGTLANEIMNILPAESTDLIDLSCQDISDDADVYLIGFEVTQDTLPLSIMDILENLESKTVLCFATCGMANTKCRESIERTISTFLPDECDYRGLFFCPGQIPASVMASMQEILERNPENERARAMLEGFQHSINHPDMEDLCSLRRFINTSGI